MERSSGRGAFAGDEPPGGHGAESMSRALGVALTWAGVLLYRLGLGSAWIHWRRHDVRVVLYHACGDQESDFIAGLGSNTRLAEFARHLDFFARHYAVIGMDQLARGHLPPRALVITFDDGYRSVHDVAAPLLRARGMTATFFLVSDVVGNGALMWVNELNWMLRRHGAAARPVLASLAGVDAGLPPRQILLALRHRCPPSAITDAVAEVRRAAGIDSGAVAAEAALYLTWDQVEEMRGDGFTFGNHTNAHPSLPRLSADAQRRAIADAAPVLSANGCHADWLAYPFGDCDATSLRAAEAAGCTFALEVGGVPGPFNPRRVGRIPVEASSDAELFAQIEVVEPAKAWVRGLLRTS